MYASLTESNAFLPITGSPTISDGGVPPIAGQNYVLECQVSGLIIDSYQWLKDEHIMLDEMRSTLSFSPLHLCDAGRYTCNVNMNYDINEHKDVTIQSKLQCHDMLT